MLRAGVPALVERDGEERELDLCELNDEELMGYLSTMNYKQHRELIRILLKNMADRDNEVHYGLKVAIDVIYRAINCDPPPELVTVADCVQDLLEKDEEVLKNPAFVETFVRSYF